MMKRCGFLLLPPDTLRPDVGAENLGRRCAGRLGDEAIIYQRSAPSKRMFEKSQADARRLRIRRVAAMSISVSEVCTLYS